MNQRIGGFCLSVIWVALLPIASFESEPIDLKVVSEIKREGFEHSQVMEALSYLTDVHGPRLTNSPNYHAASRWCVEKLKEWGLQNAQLEPWGMFGRGWQVNRFSVEMMEPQYVNLIAYPKAWTPGTNGVISGQPRLIEITSETDFEKYRGSLRGAIVMTQEPRRGGNPFRSGRNA